MIRFIRQWIIDTLGFSKSEANGTLVLILVTFLAAVLPKIYLIESRSDKESFTADQESLRQWGEELESFLELKESKSPEDTSPIVELKSFPFDPNTASLQDLISLGFSEKASTNLINYREHGGSFKVKSDLSKIYGISEERVQALWSKIQLPEVIAPKESKIVPEEKVTESKKRFDINRATAADLQAVRGIGPVLSERIVSFRDKLGGFHSSDQLREVYGLAPEVINKLSDLAIFTGEVKKININTDSLKHLYTHPYIDYNLARAIVSFRKQQGHLDSVSQIKPIKILNDSLYQKIYPYLSPNP